MIRGRVNEHHEPVIPVVLAGRRRVKVLAVIDTGFNEYLSAPARMIRNLGWEHVGVETYELASGEKMESDTYLGTVVFGGRPKQVLAAAGSPSEVLIGTRLMDGMELRIHFGSGRRSDDRFAYSSTSEPCPE